MFPVRVNIARPEENLFPVQTIRESQRNALLQNNEQDAGLIQLENINVPNIRATAARLRPSPPVRVTPNIRETAAFLSSRAENNIAPFQMSGNINIRSIAHRLRDETVTVVIPEIRSMAQDLRRRTEYLPLPEEHMEEPASMDESMATLDGPIEHSLEYTDTLQVSYHPKMGSHEEARNCDCAQVCREAVSSMKQIRCPRDSRRKGKRYGRCGRELAKRVLTFISDLKTKLQGTGAAALFQKPREITALALGVSTRTIMRMEQTEEASHRERRVHSRKRTIMATVNRHGSTWGEIIRSAIHRKLKEEEDVTISELHEDLSLAHENFTLSRTTLYRMVKGLGFSYRKNHGQKQIFERPDLVARREQYLKAIALARDREEYVVYMDETWVFSGMTKSKGWNDNRIPMFAPRSTFTTYSYGRTASKNKGRRAIVIGALAEDGIIAGCTRVFESGRADDGDYHREINHDLFESWMRESLPFMIERAGGRRVCLVIDNAPYHTRQLEKLPTSSSTKAEIKEFLERAGIVVDASATKAKLVEEMSVYIASMGGYPALRCYAAEQICNEFGVNLLRLPPFHCFFNPIELCWGQLKGFLNKYGKTSDNIALVRERTCNWLAGVARDLASAWFRDARRKEMEARAKQLMDGDEGEESSSSDSTDESVYESDDSFIFEDSDISDLSS